MFNRLSRDNPTRGYPLRARSHVMFTRLGFHFLFVAGFAMVGGALRGFNLLLVLAGVLVGALIMQWRYSRSMMMPLTAERRLPSEAFAGVPFRISYRITNGGRFLTAWMFWVQDRFGRGETKRSQWMRSEDVLGKCAVGALAARSSTFADVNCLFHQRGEYRVGPLSIATTFPLALLTSQVTFRRSESLFVFPRLLPLRSGWENNLISRSNGLIARSRASGMADGEFFGLREWQSGDHPRWIHWRTTARIGELTVRQFEQHRRFDMCILVDGFGPDTSSDSSLDADSNVELAISLAATLIAKLGGQPANRLTLAVAGVEADICGSERSAESQAVMLQQLSKLRTTSKPMLLPAIDQLTSTVGAARDVIVVSPRSFHDAEAAMDAATEQGTLSKKLAPWLARDSFRWLDVTDPSVSQWIGRPAVKPSFARGRS